MRACAIFAAFCAVSSVTVRRRHREPDIQTNILEELPSLFIPCNLTDIVTISAPPVQYNNDTLYYLYSPNNDVTQLDTTPIDPTHEENAVTDNESTKQYTKTGNNNSTSSNQSNASYNVKNVNYRQKINSKTNDVFGVKSNEFVIGPVSEEDHGNWVLSVYYKKNGLWMEIFQVITIQITENVPVWLSATSLQVGGKMELGFAYPLPDIETCELLVPAPASRPFDSYFREYSRSSLPTCTYVVPNLTIHDAGRWHIIGVGKIVYQGRVFVKLNNTGMTNSSRSARSHSYPAIGFTSSSEEIKFLKFLMMPMLGHIIKMYY